jgi:hypothetical protein
MTKLKLPKATHSGSITPNDTNIECYNLDNGERVLSRIGFLKALGRTGKAKGGRKYDEEFKTPVFLSAGNIKGLITNEILENSKPILFYDLSGNESIGYKAELLPEIAYLFAQAYDMGILKPNQTHIGLKSKILVKGFLKISIISLIDEATGYQYEREKDELQKILKAYISDELLKWQKTFPDTYYYEIFRLNGWNFTVNDIRKRPSVIGKWTNKVIYEQLPKGVLKELKEKTPKSKAGNYTARFFQSLTSDTGNPHLSAQLNQVIAIMRISDNWEQFIVNFNKMVDRKNGQLELKFSDLEPKDEEIKEIKPLGDFDKTVKKFLETPPPKKDKE